MMRSSSEADLGQPRMVLNIKEEDISAHNELTSSYWYYVIMQLVRFSKHVETYVTYLNRLQVALFKQVSEAIARLKYLYIKFPTADMLPQIKLDFWRISAFSNVVETIDCTHIKIPCPGGGR